MRNFYRTFVLSPFVMMLACLPALAQQDPIGGAIASSPEFKTAAPPAQQRSNPQNCNQSAANPVVDFKVNGTPRFALASQDGCWIFLQVQNFRENNTATNGVAVLRRDGGAIRLVRFQPIEAHGEMAFTPNQKMIVTAGDRQLVFLDVSALTSGSGNPIRGTISDVHFSSLTRRSTVSVSRDGRYLFASQTVLAWISIIDLQKVEAGVFGPEAIAGGFATEDFPGIVVSPDEKHLFFVSHPPPSVDSSLKCRAWNSGSVRDPLVNPAFAISVVNIGTALSNSAPEVVAAVSAGCSTDAPLAPSPDGRTLYMSSHSDHTLLAFDLRPFLEGGRAPTLIGTVPVGSNPRDQVVVDGGRKVIVANSSQYYGTAADKETLTVIDTAKIASGAEAVLGIIRVGADPRNLSVTPDGRTLLVSSVGSRTLQLIDLERMPLEPVSSKK